MRRFGFLVAAGLLAFAAAGCGTAGRETAGSGGKMRVAASISVLRDMTQEVGGGRVEVSTIVPVGASVETFQPTPSGAREIAGADLVVENGAGLESWMGGLIRSAGGENKPVVKLSKGLRPIKNAGSGSAEVNPHFWLDVENAEHYVRRIRDALIRVDPAGEEQYRRNAGKYLAELDKLDGYIQKRAREIPPENRKLVTSHDAFPYFARAYGFELAGVVLRNPNAEPGARDVAGIINTVEREDVPAIFTEPQFNPNLADTIASEAGVEVVELYSDTLAGDGPGASYESMMRKDIDRIVGALG